MGHLERIGALGARMGRRVRSAFADLPAGDDVQAFRKDIRRAQIVEALRLTNILALTHIFIACVVALAFGEEIPLAWMIGFLACITLPAITAVVGARLYRANEGSDAAVEIGHRIARVGGAFFGFAWGAIPVIVYPGADAGGRLIVVALCAGLIGDAYVVGPIMSVMLLVTLPVVAGSFAALLMVGDQPSLVMACMLGVYSLFVLMSARRMIRAAVWRFLDQTRLREQSETIGLLLNDFEANTSDWLWETDADGMLRHVSPRLSEVMGLSPEALRNESLPRILCGMAAGGPRVRDASVVSSLFDARVPFRERAIEVTVAGERRWWRLSGKPVLDKGGTFDGFRGVGSDVTEAKNSEDRIAYLASFDFLTGLANRSLLLRRAEELRTAGRGFALVYVDLDGFKAVNDTYGHACGDALLRQVADRLTALAGDDVQVGRLGGDEFALLHRGDGLGSALAFGQRIVEALSETYDVGGVQAFIGASVGVAMSPDDADSVEALFGKADLALYSAKSAGKGRVCPYDPAMEVPLRSRRELETGLRAAVAQERLELHYQPLVALADGKVRAFEALLRWNKPDRGYVSPAEFVPVAESVGLIPVIGRWVLMKACADAATWPEDVRVAVNISPIQFRNPELANDVRSALAASGLSPSRLELEITESVFLDMGASTLSNLEELRALGVRFALDDFGTGYSSLSYLVRFPVDKIKIDRAFVKDMCSSEECLAVIEAILAMAKRLRMTVTAEGVETEGQAQALMAGACDDIQGFLFSAAKPGAEVEGLVQSLPERYRGLFPIPEGTGSEPLAA